MNQIQHICNEDLLYDDVHPHLFFLFFQLCFRLLHFVDKHLPHFLLFPLQIHKELLPLGFVCLLKAEDQGKSNVELSLISCLDRISTQEMVTTCEYKFKLG